MSEITVPVLIVGGGGAGLTASMLLSSYGIDSLLVSKYPGTSHLPKAHVLHQKTMEIYREVGVAETVYERGTPPENMAFTAWYAGVAGPTPEYGREIGRLESWGNGDTDPNWMKASPCCQANLTADSSESQSSRPMPRLWDPDVSVSTTISFPSNRTVRVSRLSSRTGRMATNTPCERAICSAVMAGAWLASKSTFRWKGRRNWPPKYRFTSPPIFRSGCVTRKC